MGLISDADINEVAKYFVIMELPLKNLKYPEDKEKIRKEFLNGFEEGWKKPTFFQFSLLENKGFRYRKKFFDRNIEEEPYTFGMELGNLIGRFRHCTFEQLMLPPILPKKDVLQKVLKFKLEYYRDIFSRLKKYGKFYGMAQKRARLWVEKCNQTADTEEKKFLSQFVDVVVNS